MNEAKLQRQRALADLIRAEPIGSQEEAAARLAALGFDVTQATVSRDLDQLQAIKVRRNGRVSYALAGEIAPEEPRPDRLSEVLRGWLRSADAAANLVVMRTSPGSAHVVGVALDEAALSEVVGTICGDDTIFAACRSAEEARALAERFRTLALGRPS